QIIDLKGLMGDASDNIPGIKGVGEKTALKLLAEFESIENLYEHLDELPGNKMKEKIVAGKESAFLSKKLATIVTDVPIAFELEELAFRGLEDQALYQVLSSLEFSSLIKRRGLAGEQIQAKEPECFSLRKREEIERLKKEAKAAGRLALCQEGDVLYFAVKPEEEFELALSYTLLDEGLSPSDAIEQLKAILEEPAIAKTAHDAKALLHLFGEQGCQVEGIDFDTALADYVLDPTQRNFTIEKLKNRYHAAGRASALFAVEEAQKRQIKEKQLEEVYYHIELPLLYVLYSMELQGVRVNLQLLQKLKVEYAEQIDSLVKEIYELAGTDSFNIASTKQLGVVLFEKLGLPVIKKTKTGYSTDIEVLERLQGQHPIIQKLIEYRQVTKLKSTYIDGLEAVVDPKTHKVHTTFNQLVTATGRISSTEPNLQNIPVRSDFGAKIRELFIPENEKNLIVAADYSQIELRVLADITNDRHLCDAFNND
ncbi:MAG: DNA polymerase I, partial [Clostridiales bacterium]|nr:DNA polymerase I [Clostridiales bacterium]